MNEEIYVALDTVLEQLTPEQIADYIWMNCPSKGSDITEAINARVMLAIMESNPEAFNNLAKEE